MSPKKALTELVAALKVDGVVLRVTVDEQGRRQCFRVVASHAGLVANAAKLAAEAEQTVQATVSGGQPATEPGPPPIVKAAKYAAAVAEKFEYTILRVFGEKVGPFDMSWPVRVERQHLDPRTTTNWKDVCETEDTAGAHRAQVLADNAKLKVPDEHKPTPKAVAFPTLFAEIMNDPETQAMLTHIAELEA